MAVVSLTNKQKRTLFFQQAILNDLQYWRDWLTEQANDTAALDKEQKIIIKVLSFALDLHLDEAWSLTCELIEAFAGYMERRGYWGSWNWILSRAIDAAKKREDEAQLAAIYHLLSRLQMRQSHFREGVASYRQTIQLARRIGDHFNEGRACTNLGFYYTERGYLYRAKVLCCHALRLFDEIGSNHGLAHTENHLGNLYIQQRQWDEAKQHLKNACDIWQEMADDYGLMLGFLNFGLLYLGMERGDEALSWSEKALHQAELTKDVPRIGTIRNNIACAYLLKDEPIKAEKYAWQAEAIFRPLAHRLGLAQVEDSLGLAYLEQGKWKEAALYLEAALKAWRNLGNEYQEIEVMTDMVQYELARRNQAMAAERIGEVQQRLNQVHKDARYEHLQSRLTHYRRTLTDSS